MVFTLASKMICPYMLFLSYLYKGHKVYLGHDMQICFVWKKAYDYIVSVLCAPIDYQNRCAFCLRPMPCGETILY